MGQWYRKILHHQAGKGAERSAFRLRLIVAGADYAGTPEHVFMPLVGEKEWRHIAMYLDTKKSARQHAVNDGR